MRYILTSALILACGSISVSCKQGAKTSTPDQAPQDTIVWGKIFTERIDDVAWENDKIGFRIFSKKAGGVMPGYDIFTKKGKYPVLQELYDVQICKENQDRVAYLRETDPKEAKRFADSISYHIDHGKGMDYYLVGPTLGCGTAALVVDEKIVYPDYYSKCEILKNDPLQFSMRLEYDPVIIDGDTVVQERILTLDAGTHFNKIEVRYKGLTKPTKVVAGIVLHDEAKQYQMTDNSIAYIEPMHEQGWQTYTAVIFDDKMKPEISFFSEEEKATRGGAYGHIQAEGIYQPNTTLTYYMGAGWNGWEFSTVDQWFEYVENSESLVK